MSCQSNCTMPWCRISVSDKTGVSRSTAEPEVGVALTSSEAGPYGP